MESDRRTAVYRREERVEVSGPNRKHGGIFHKPLRKNKYYFENKRDASTFLDTFLQPSDAPPPPQAPGRLINNNRPKPFIPQNTYPQTAAGHHEPAPKRPVHKDNPREIIFTKDS